MAEATGIFMIMTGGCGFVCANKYAKWPVGPMGGPGVFALAVMLAVYTTRDVSGAHLNPAITATLALNRPADCPKEIIAPYLASQMVGATLGAGVNYLIFRNGIKQYEKTHGLTRGAKGSCDAFNGAFGMVADRRLMPKSWMVFAAEVAMTGGLAFIVFGLTDPKKSVPAAAQPVGIAALVFTVASQGAPVTGCGMNPARDLGPRIITQMAGWGRANWSFAWWAYTAGPIVGACLGGFLYNQILALPEPKK
jgi:glycerol uptake facilitator protein